MTIKTQIITVIISGIVLLVLDYFYLNSAGTFFNNLVISIQGSKIKIKIIGLILCYLTLILGINYFIILNTDLNYPKKLMNSFLLGLLIYGVYEFTNYSILNKWNFTAVVIDTTWGGFLFLLTTFITLGIVKKLKLK